MTPSTIRNGSSGPDVQKWQTIIGVTADGSFGPATEAATRTWQTKHKLVADGVVGPATWGVALGIKPSGKPQPTPQASTDQWAYNVAKNAAPQDSEQLRQYVLTDARGEGFYGNGWNNVNAAAASVGLVGNEGVGSNNWGATQGSGDAGSFPHIDYHADGTAYVGMYKKWSTPEKGFLDMRNVILGGGTKGAAGAAAIKAAIQKGNLHDAVYQQHANGYFELAPDKYLASMLHNYQILSVNVPGWAQVLAENGISAFKRVLKWTFGLSLVALSVVGGLIIMEKHK